MSDSSAHEPIVGRYVRVEFDDEVYRTYYETAGDGPIPLVCLHTAGADSRQWRHVLTDESLYGDYTVYAFDMPRHGRTLPGETGEWWRRQYELTTEFYSGFVRSVLEALAVRNPVVVGCSMGGAIVVELAVTHGDDLRAVVGVEATAHAPTRDLGFLRHPRVNQEAVRPEWIYGLQSPKSPERRRYESWWIYSQGGDEVYAGDIHFYATEWDARELVEATTELDCAAYFLTGEYDYSAPPSAGRWVAENLPGAQFTLMEELGHFPMTENPELFATYLNPVLVEVAESNAE